MYSHPARTRFLRLASLGGLLFCIGAAALASSDKGILFPNWSKPTKGTYSEPSGEIGKKPAEDQPWTVTTVTSSIEGKPLPGKPVTVVGEIIDLSCYLQVGKHGEKHRACGQKCVNNGQPIGLLTKEGTLYMLMPEEHDPRRDGGLDLRPAAAEHMGHIVTVNGTEASHMGYRAIFVQGMTK